MVVLLVLCETVFNEERLLQHSNKVLGQETLICIFTKPKAFARFIKNLRIQIYVFIGKPVRELLLPRMATTPLTNQVELGMFNQFLYEFHGDSLLCPDIGYCIALGVRDLETFTNINNVKLPSLPELPLETKTPITIQPVEYIHGDKQITNMRVCFLTASWKSPSQLYLFFVDDIACVCVILENPFIPVLTTASVEPLKNIHVLVTGDVTSNRNVKLVPSSMYFNNRQKYEYNRHYVSDTVLVERVLTYLDIAAGDIFEIPAQPAKLNNSIYILEYREVPEWMRNASKVVFGDKPEHIKSILSLSNINLENNKLVVSHYPRNATKDTPSRIKTMNSNDGDLFLFLSKVLNDFDPDIVLCNCTFTELEDAIQKDLNIVLSRITPFGSSISGRLVCFEQKNAPYEFIEYICNVASFNGFAGNQLGVHQNRHIEPSLQFIARRSPLLNGLLLLSITHAKQDSDSGDAGGLNFSFYKEKKLLENIWVVDFDSCFPSIIVSKTIGPPLKSIKNGNTTILAINPLLSMYCKKLIDIRKANSACSYNKMYKLMSNVCYGWFYAVFNEVGKEIAAESRSALTLAVGFFEEKGITVLSGHTDSLFLQTTQDVPALVDELNTVLSTHYGPTSIMHISIKGRYSNFLQIHMNAWAADNGTTYKGLVKKNMSGWVVNIIETALKYRFQNDVYDGLWDYIDKKIHELAQHTIGNLPDNWFLYYEHEEVVSTTKTILHGVGTMKNGRMSVSKKYKYMHVLNHAKGRIVFVPFSDSERKMKIDVVTLVATDLNTVLSQILDVEQGTITEKLRHIFISLPVAIFASGVYEKNFCVHCSYCYSHIATVLSDELSGYIDMQNSSLCRSCTLK